MKHILIAYDGSVQAEKAFNFAVDLAHHYQAKLTVLAVAQIPEPLPFSDEESEVGDILHSLINRFNTTFIQLRKKAESYLLAIQFIIVDGSPAQEIVHQAEQLQVDHIVVGHRGISRFKRWLAGSVAKQVMIYAHCSITIIR